MYNSLFNTIKNIDLGVRKGDPQKEILKELNKEIDAALKSIKETLVQNPEIGKQRFSVFFSDLELTINNVIWLNQDKQYFKNIREYENETYYKAFHKIQSIVHELFDIGIYNIPNFQKSELAKHIAEKYLPVSDNRRQVIETEKNKKKSKELPPYDKVFFVHYQCEDFNKGDHINSLCIYSKGNIKEYSGNEIESIKEYAQKVRALLDEGLILIHWNQNSPIYGTDHINKRYKDLTGKDLQLKYSNQINLSEWLIFKYGDEYIPHPRLDNLAKLNGFIGIRDKEKEQCTFSLNRLSLLTKIYFKALKGTLRTENKNHNYIESKKAQLGKISAKHHVLTFLLECYAKGESLPNGEKKVLESIGEKRTPDIKGNTFYKNFNNITKNYDLNKESHLIEIGGDNWRTIVKYLSKEPEIIETYLKSKRL